MRLHRKLESERSTGHLLHTAAKKRPTTDGHNLPPVQSARKKGRIKTLVGLRSTYTKNKIPGLVKETLSPTFKFTGNRN